MKYVTANWTDVCRDMFAVRDGDGHHASDGASDGDAGRTPQLSALDFGALAHGIFCSAS